jgi:hypothetical protein
MKEELITSQVAGAQMMATYSDPNSVLTLEE